GVLLAPRGVEGSEGRSGVLVDGEVVQEEGGVVAAVLFVAILGVGARSGAERGDRRGAQARGGELLGAGQAWSILDGGVRQSVDACGALAGCGEYVVVGDLQGRVETDLVSTGIAHDVQE
ncbi:hypothetical protein HK101_000468, partial [Irineochytrium annulatum]